MRRICPRALDPPAVLPEPPPPLGAVTGADPLTPDAPPLPPGAGITFNCAALPPGTGTACSRCSSCRRPATSMPPSIRVTPGCPAWPSGWSPTRLESVDRRTAQVVNERPDLDLAARALASGGPSWPALQAVDYDRFTKAIREETGPLCTVCTEGLGVRIASEFRWIIGRVPST